MFCNFILPISRQLGKSYAVKKITRLAGIIAVFIKYGMCEPDTGKFKVKKNDVIVLATDGLYKMVAHDFIIKILNNDCNLKQKTTALMDAALSFGGKDNITIILAYIKQIL